MPGLGFWVLVFGILSGRFLCGCRVLYFVVCVSLGFGVCAKWLFVCCVFVDDFFCACCVCCGIERLCSTVFGSGVWCFGFGFILWVWWVWVCNLCYVWFTSFA